MATQTQVNYITDLAVIKTKEFKEVKELLIAKGIVGENAEIVRGADSLATICNALTDAQASRLIDVLIQTKPPQRAMSYATKRSQQTIDTLDDIKRTIDDWGF